MRRHLVTLFYSLLAINAVYILFVALDHFGNKSTFKSISPANLFESYLYQIVKPVDKLSTKRAAHNTSVIMSYDVRKSIPTNNQANKTRKGEHGQIPAINNTRKREHGQTPEIKNDTTNSNNEEREIPNNLELLFPGYMRRNNVTKVDNPGENRIQLQFEVNVIEKKDKLILMYYSDSMTNNERMKTKHCNVHRCRFSSDLDEYPDADALLFSGMSVFQKIPKLLPNQVSVFVRLESAAFTRYFPGDVTFNWTATYRRDSVIPTPYEIFQPKEDNHEYYKDAHRRRRYKNYAKGKTKLVAWFVSNCYARNNRLEYAKELQKYIQVDIYGRCGTLKCSSHKSEVCMDMLKREYKFYLAFENSNCKDYITEKFFNALR